MSVIGDSFWINPSILPTWRKAAVVDMISRQKADVRHHGEMGSRPHYRVRLDFLRWNNLFFANTATSNCLHLSPSCWHYAQKASISWWSVTSNEFCITRNNDTIEKANPFQKGMMIMMYSTVFTMWIERRNALSLSHKLRITTWSKYTVIDKLFQWYRTVWCTVSSLLVYCTS